MPMYANNVLEISENIFHSLWGLSFVKTYNSKIGQLTRLNICRMFTFISLCWQFFILCQFVCLGRQSEVTQLYTAIVRTHTAA